MAVLGKDRKPVLAESRKWYVEYKDADGIVRHVPGFADKKATEQLAAKLEREAARRRTGLIDRHSEHRQRPLSEHLAEWEAYLLAKGNTPAHAHKSAARAGAVLEGCSVRFWPEVSASAMQVYLNDLRRPRAGRRSLGTSTANDYLRSVKQFMGCLVRDDRAPHNPLAHLQRFNAKTDVRRRRRPLSPEESKALLAAAEAGESRHGLSGHERAMVYRLALETGLRIGELRSLTPTSFDLAGSPPTVTVQAAYSKHRREDVQPIPPQLAKDLRDFLEARDDQGPVFAEFRHTAEAIRTDLADAGIPYQDSAGRFADFHSLRHTYITNLAKAGVPTKVAMDLARHGSVELTMGFYSHTLVSDRAEALEALPDLTGQAAGRRRAAATGTDDATPFPADFMPQNAKQNDKPQIPGYRQSSQLTRPGGIRTRTPPEREGILSP